jgi:type IX secretion system PorP/SprF family membrane protein
MKKRNVNNLFNSDHSEIPQRLVISAMLCLILLISLDVCGQSRKYIGQFNQMQSYFNPGMTALEGSVVKGLVRNQWVSWEGAPQTYTFAAELDFAENSIKNDLGKNVVGINLLREEFGAFLESELIANYSTRVRISKQAVLRFGLGVNFNQTRIDGNRLTTEQTNDASLNQYLGGFARMNVIEFNSGLSLVHPKYYVSYGAHNLNQGKMITGDVFTTGKPRVDIVQAGYRQKINEQMNLIINGMWRHQADLSNNMEMNLKLMLMDTFWVGSGLRVKYANSLQMGFLFGNVHLGYTFEIPISRVNTLLPNMTNEFTLSYYIFGKRNASIW